uniref:CA domain-containing protein n=1 Tax=Syphacia muris TaxID=451379 RepID=A0A0N5ACL5_9BILA
LCISTKLDLHKFFSYRINRISDPKRQFTITNDGRLLVANALDREEIPKYYLSVEAVEKRRKSNNILLLVVVNDANDNAPVPYILPENCLFMEHIPAGNLPLCEIRAFDLDTNDNGPPFKMTVSSSFQYNDYVRLTFNKSTLYD